MRILLVEDDERIINFVKRGLEAEGYHIDVATDGNEGIAAGAEPYRLIILDLLLPGASGTEVCRVLRQRGVQTPILILTAKDSIQDKVEGLQIGADDYLTKPFAFEELLARVEALFRRGAYHEPAKTLRIADLTLNRDTRDVYRGDTLLNLTNKEYSLLEYLMSHPNKALSRTRILEHVWGHHHDTLTNVVDVYIRYLRNKVDRPSAHKLIHTIRDVGYKISE